MLGLFKNAKVDDSERIFGVVASLVPAKVDHDDYDFVLNLSKENLGVEGHDLEIRGSGSNGESEFQFKIPVTQAKIKYSLGEKWQNHMDYNAKVFEENEWAFEVDGANMTIENAELTDEEK